MTTKQLLPWIIGGVALLNAIGIGAVVYARKS